MERTPETPRSLDDLLEPGTTLMVGTRSGQRDDLEFRPLTVARVDDGQIQVLLDTNEQWVADLVPPGTGGDHTQRHQVERLGSPEGDRHPHR